MAYGGSRSAKTFGFVYAIIKRATVRPSRHLIVRRHYNAAYKALVEDTIPKVAKLAFPGLSIHFNHGHSYFEIPTAESGELSQIWISGTDDKDRAEKILGTEFSTIFFNECSEYKNYEVIELLRTRCAQNIMKNKFFYDQNPGSKRHWSYKMFMENLLPDGQTHTFDVGHVHMNPGDNPYLPPDYISQTLANQSKKNRARFLEGVFTLDVEGALWNEDMLRVARTRKPGKINRIVVAIDPSVSNTDTSDECGIVILSTDDKNGGMVLADESGKMSPGQWAKAAVEAYRKWKANLIVAEGNQGGDLIALAIHNIDPNIKVEIVHARRSKEARAEPVSMMYEQGRISHPSNVDLSTLEDELTNWVPGTGASPNRLDALVWGFTYLLQPDCPILFSFI